MTHINQNLLPLRELLPRLLEKNNDYTFWLELESELREYLCIDMRSIVESEDPFQNLLIEIYQNPKKFTPTDEIYEIDVSFFKKISLLKLAFLNRVRKSSLDEVRQRIIMLEKKKTLGKLGSDESKILWNLKKVRSKYLGRSDDNED